MSLSPTAYPSATTAQPKRPRRRWRRLIWTFALALLSLLLATPLWTPWLLRAVGRSFGLTFQTATRNGYWRLHLDQLSIDQPSFHLHTRRVSVLQPLGWLVERIFPGSLAHPESPPFLAEGWRLALTPSSSPTTSTAQALDQVVLIAHTLHAWLPKAHLVNGAISLASSRIDIPEITWEADKHLGATLRTEHRSETATLRCSLLSPAAIEAHLQHPLGILALTFRRQNSDQWTAQGILQAANNNLAIHGQFGPYGWLPLTATADLEEIHWPTNLFAPPASLAPIRGRLAATWTSNRLTLTAIAASRLHLPGLAPQDFSTRLHAEGPLERLTLQAATLASDLLQLELEAPAEIPFPDFVQSTNLAWTLKGNLSPLALSPFHGQVTGLLRLEPTAAGPPTLRLTLHESQLSAWNQTLSLNEARLSLAWPDLQLEQLHLANGDAHLTAQGHLDLLRQEWTQAHWRLHSLPPLLTNHLRLSNAEIQGTLSGPLLAPQHTIHGVLSHLQLPGCHPLSLDLSLQGDSLPSTLFQVRATTHSDALTAEGTLQWQPSPSPSGVLHLSSLAWLRGDLPLLHLRAPIYAQWSHSPGALPPSPTLRLTLPNLELVGDGRHARLTAALDWPASGTLALNAAGLRGHDLSHLLPATPSWLDLETLDLSAAWTNGPLTLDANVALALHPSTNNTFHLAAELHGSEDEFRFHANDVRREGEPVGTLSGRIPLTLHPQEPASLLRLRPLDAIDTRLVVSQQAPIWRELAARWGILLDDAALDLQLAGTAAAPTAQLRFQATRLRALHPPTNQPELRWPPIDQPHLRIDLEPNGLLSVHAEANLANQRGTLQASLPLNLEALRHRTTALDLALLQPLEAQLRLPHWDLAPLAALFPGYLSPQGSLDLTAHLQHGLRPKVTLSLTNAATRPLPPFGPLRHLQATLLADESKLQLLHGQAELGGQPLLFSGSWNLQPPSTKDEPAFRFSLSGTNLPLARQSDLSLRGTLDLDLAGLNLTNATLNGSVQLQNSLLLRDLHSLLSGNLKEPASRPPFFSLSDPPWGDWRLNVRVEGNRFLRVVTPVFHGRVSTGIQLAGTLREPIALGELTVPEGRVRFPFGGLNVDSGRISLSREDPFLPHLDFQATGLNFGYEVRMNVSGPASDPNVLLSSVPPLSSTQILLMLTSGEVPNHAFEYSTRSRLQNLALFVGQDFLGKLTSNPDNDRLTLRSGERISDQGQLTYTIEYRLTPRWSVFGMQDRFDTYLGGLKWRVYSK